MRDLLDRLADPALLVDREGHIQAVNPAFTQLLGHTREELMQKSIDVLVPRKLRAAHAEHRKAFATQLRARPMAERKRLDAQHKDGGHVPVEVSLTPLGPGRDDQILVLVRSVVQQIALEARARLADAALTATATAVLVTDTLGRIVLANDAFTRLTGWMQAEVLGENPRFLRSNAHGPEVFHALWTTLLEGRTWSGELVNLRKDGTRYIEANTITPIRSATGTITHYVAVKEDVTARHEAAEHAARRIHQLGVMSELAGLGQRSSSPAAFAHAAASILKERLRLDFVTIEVPAGPLSGEVDKARTERLLTFGSTTVGRFIARHGDLGLPEPERALLDAVTSQLGALLHTLALIESLRTRASTDALTVLANRSALVERGNEEVARAHRYGRPLSVVLLDVDHFKDANDRHGHAFGDEVLRVLGGLLLHQRRKTDLAARYGGDELVLLLPETAPDEAVVLAERLRAALRRHRFPSDTTVTASFGVAGLKPGQTLAELLSGADAALYEAKRRGRDQVVTTAMTAVHSAAGGTSEERSGTSK